MMENQHIFFTCHARSTKEWGDYDMNYQPSAINNSTPLHFTPPFWSCTEAAASAENRTDPMWLWLVVMLLFIFSTAYSRATEPVIGGVPPLDGICLAELFHGGCWSCYKVSGHSAQKERTEKQTNELRDGIFSRKGTCYWAVVIIVVRVYWSVTKTVAVRRSSCCCYCCCCGIRSFTISGPAHAV